MEVELDPKAIKQYMRLNQPNLKRITDAIDRLELEPPQGDIIKLQGKDGYRVRVGEYRIIFDIEPERVYVYKIVRRGQAYKRSN
jgi:mRNA interferase RelE/StbE